ncbi:hypothetical protein CA14_007931 [Aspergillus flavus]|uniref:GPI anchored protein n=1 Tax=Aspergillus flavus TaxID=5059 RepID=A0AB74BV42_ASPFL|nr:hypothetical protein CA14_007931 [Aspergillus flavus]
MGGHAVAVAGISVEIAPNCQNKYSPMQNTSSTRLRSPVPWPTVLEDIWSWNLATEFLQPPTNTTVAAFSSLLTAWCYYCRIPHNAQSHQEFQSKFKLNADLEIYIQFSGRTLALAARMKVFGWISAAFFASTVLSIETLPFSPPQSAEANKRAYEVLRILKRADSCPAGYDPCSNMGRSDVCCRQGSVCSRDAADNIACCPTGAKCTGSLTGDSTSASTSFRFPGTATVSMTTTGPNDATITGSTMPGAYPFVYVPTTFPNAGVCSSYYSLCQSEYTGCLSSLGGGYAVTVAAEGGGVTRAGGGAAGAVSTCSSLSMNACHGLNLGYCDTYATGTGDMNRAPPGRTSSLEDLVFGVVIGVAVQRSAASPLDFDEAGLEKRCANSCGYYGQLCCSSGQTCSTDSNGQAVCADSSGGSWQYFTTTFVTTETDVATVTSTWSSYVGQTTTAGGGSGSCKAELGETICGNTCCGAAYVCSNNQCVMGSSSIWATATATPPVRGTSASTITATASATTTQGFVAPVGTDGAQLIGEKAPDNGGLSGGAIAGIVIGTIAGVFLLLLLCACLCCRGALEALFACLGLGGDRRRRKETTYVEDRYSHHTHGGRPEGRTWFGSRPSAPPPQTSEKKKWGGLATLGIMLGALALCLGLKRRRDHEDEKSDYTYPSSYYYSDYYTSTTQARIGERDGQGTLDNPGDLARVHDDHD